MRASTALLLLFEIAVITQSMSVQEEEGAGAVFELGHLVDEAEQFAKGATVKSPEQTALQRIEAMKNRLASKMLNSEISAAGYTEAELGEGMAVETLKSDKVSKAYDSFKNLGKTLQSQKAAMEKKVKKTALKMTAAEKKEMKTRKDAAELRKKLRASVPKKKDAKMKDQAKQWKDKVAALKKKLKAAKAKAAKKLKAARKKLNKTKKTMKKALQKRKKKVDKQREADVQMISRYKKKVEKQWYVNMKQVMSWKKKVRNSKDKIKDLTAEVKDNDRKFKEMESGLKAKFMADERDALKKAGKKLKKQSKVTKGEKQKEKWDQRTVLKAKKMAKQEGKLMAKAMKGAEKAATAASSTKSKLTKLKRLEKAEVKQGKRKINKLKLKDDLEKLKQNNAEAKISAVKVRALRANKSVAKTEKREVKKVLSKEETKVRRLKRELTKMQERYATRERVSKAEMQRRVERIRLAKDKEVDTAKKEAGQKQEKEDKAEQAAASIKKKEVRLRDELVEQKRELKKTVKREQKEQVFFKKQVKKDAGRIKKRAGSRTVAVAEEKRIRKLQASLAIKSAALKRATARLNKLSTGKDAVQQAADNYKRKLKHAKYRVYTEKKKQRELKLALKKMQVKYEMSSKHAKNEEMLGESGSGKDALKNMEMRYKSQVKETQAFSEKLEMLTAKSTKSYSRSQKWEAKAKQYKQAMDAALLHARRIGERVRKGWATKLIKEQDDHIKEIQKLKNRMVIRQAKYDAEVIKLNDKANAAETAMDSAKNSAGNQGMMTQYIAGLVGEQRVKGRVLRKYMTKMGKIRKKYNTKLGEEWKEEIKRQKKELDAYKNGRKMTKLKYKIMLLKQKLKAKKKQRHMNLEVKRAQNLDIQTILHAALSRAQQGSKKRTAEENRQRVVSAVNAVVKTVMSADRVKGNELAKQAIHTEPAATPSDHEQKLEAAVEKLKQQNTALKGKLAAKDNKTRNKDTDKSNISPKVVVSTDVKNSEGSKKKKLTAKQAKLWNQLHSLVKMSELPGANRVKKSTKKNVHKQLLGQPISTIGQYSLEKLGKLQKGAMLPAEEVLRAELGKESN